MVSDDRRVLSNVKVLSTTSRLGMLETNTVGHLLSPRGDHQKCLVPMSEIRVFRGLSEERIGTETNQTHR